MPVEIPDQRTDVLVVGGGLVGLAAALFLARSGARCLLAERHASTSLHPRARGVNVRTMEILRSAELEPAIRGTQSARALDANAGIVMARSLAGESLGELRRSYVEESLTDLAALSPTGWCLCDQDELEPVLRDAAAASGADVRFSTELVSWTQDDGISAVLADGARQWPVRAKFLVAADGAGSPIRSGLEIGMSGPGTLAHYMNIYFRADLTEALGDRRFILCYIAGAAVMGALLPVNNTDRWLLHIPYDPVAGGRELFGEPRCAELIRAAAGVPGLDLEVVDVLPWEAAGRTADRFRAGRVFLAGDAAHVMPPTGAFGSNTGIQDAHNLAWKLAAVLRGDAGPALLDSYEAERRPVVRATVEQAVLRSKDRPRSVTAARRRASPAILPDNMVIFGYRYGLDGAGPGWDYPPSGMPGSRAPHVTLRRAGRELSALDLLGPRFTVLCGTADPGWPAAACELAGQLRAGLAVHRIGTGPGQGDVWDPDGSWQAAYGVGPAGAVLIRPDGIVAWRSAAAAAGDATAALATALAGALAAGR
jgi:putative polyketide hydroxylase